MTERLSDATTGTDTSGPGSDSVETSETRPEIADSRKTTEGTVYTVTGGDWDDVLADAVHDERIVMNIGPQHPSTHGVLRLVLELEGETVTARPLRHRLPAHRHREEPRVPQLDPGRHVRDAHGLPGAAAPRGRVLPGGREAARRQVPDARAGHPRAADGDQPDQLAPRRARHRRHGARRAHRHDRRLPRARGGAAPAGVPHRPADEPRVHPARRPRAGPARRTASRRSRDFLKIMHKRLPDYDKLLTGQPIWRNRLEGVGYLPVDACLALGITGPILRSAGLPWDLRKIEPYCGYENYEFDVPTSNAADCFARYLLRLEEMHQSLRIIKQVVDEAATTGPVMVEDAQDRLARAAHDRQRRHGQLARARPQDHGPVDGVADPPLQAGDRGLPGSGRPGVRAGRVAARRAGLPRRLRRRHPADARARARTQLREPAVDARDERGRHGRRRHRGRRLDRPGDGWLDR